MAERWRTGLNDEQARAAGYDGGPLIVLAGPGTGKTRVIIARIVRLIEEGADPASILALAFNVKAAAELRQRLADALDPAVVGAVQASTFHSFGNSLVARFGDWIGVRSERVLMDSALPRRILRRLIFDHGLFEHLAGEGREGGVGRGLAFITACKNAAKPPPEARAYAEDWRTKVERNDEALEGDALTAARREAAEFLDCARLYEVYDAECMHRGSMTFDDCLMLPLRIFTEKPEAAAIVRDEIRHIVVDEFQDQNRVQIELLRHLAPPRSAGGRAADLCVVGDDDQAIYGFRGADSRAFSRFAEVWPENERIALTGNYRSVKAVVSAAGAIIARSTTRFEPGKSIRSAGEQATAAGIVEGVLLDDDADAGVVVASMIVLDRRENPGGDFRRYGVIAPTNGVVDEVAEALRLQGIPVAVSAQPGADEAVHDLMAWIELLADPTGPGEGARVRRLLARPPFFVPSGQLMEWMSHHARAKSEEAGPLSFVEWLRRHAKEDATVSRFLALLEGLRQEAMTKPAQRVVFEVIRQADLAHAEDQEPRARAARVNALVRAISFARTRQGLLDEPGDIAAFWDYCRDLQGNEEHFVLEGDERLDGDPEADADPPDAVQVLTAHKAKGLEFDTVFLVKCRRDGFPARDRSRSERPVLPIEFSGVKRDDHEDEQRRVFYVACTRAERRLVLLAKKMKGVSRKADYFHELTAGARSRGPEPPSPEFKVATRDASEILEKAGLAPDDRILAAAGDEATAAHRREAIIRAEAAIIRGHAYAALHDATVAGLSAESLARIRDRLGDAAGALQALEELRARGALPGSVPTDYRGRLEGVVRRFAEAPGRTEAKAGMTPPLWLSFSRISAYEQCPACFYLRQVLRVPEEKGDALLFGSVIHAALERFFGEVRDAEGAGRPAPGSDRLARVVQQTMREMWPADRPIDARMMDRAQAQARAAAMQLHEPGSNILELERSVTFRYPDPDQPGLFHTFNAKLDRVDQPPGGGVRVVDYKTGNMKKDLVEPKSDDLQMCIYAMALSPLFNGSESGELPRAGAEAPEGLAEYWLLAGGVRGTIRLQDLDLAEARRRIDAAIRGMLAGRFPRGKDCKKDCAIFGAVE